MGMSPTVHYQEDMATAKGSGKLVAGDIPGGIGYQMCYVDGDGVKQPSIGDLNMGLDDNYVVTYLLISGDGNITINLQIATHTGSDCNWMWDRYHMTVIVASVEHKVTLERGTTGDVDCATAEPEYAVYTGTIDGLHDAIVANSNSAVFRFDAPDMGICE